MTTIPAAKSTLVSRHYSGPAVDFTLSASRQSALDLFNHAFEAFAVRDGHRSSQEYRVECVGGESRLELDGCVVGIFADEESAVDYLIWHVSQAALSKVDDSVALHAAGLATDDRAILLVGRSGTGKSTLTMELLRRGMDYLSDEAVLVSTVNGEVKAFPRPVGLQVSRDHPKVLHLNDALPGAGGRVGTKMYYDPSRYGAQIVEGFIQPSAIVFLRSLRAPTVLEMLPRAEAVPLLVDQVFASEPSTLIFETLVKLASQTQSFSLQSGDPATAAGMLLDLVQPPASR